MSSSSATTTADDTTTVDTVTNTSAETSYATTDDTTTGLTTTEDSSSSQSSDSSSEASSDNTTMTNTEDNTADTVLVAVQKWKDTTTEQPYQPGLTSDDATPTSKSPTFLPSGDEDEVVGVALDRSDQIAVEVKAELAPFKGKYTQPPKPGDCLERINPLGTRYMCEGQPKVIRACCASERYREMPYLGVEWRPSPWFCVILGMIIGGVIVCLAGYLVIAKPLRDFEANLEPAQCHIDDHDDEGDFAWAEVTYISGRGRGEKVDCYVDSRVLLFDNPMEDGDKESFVENRPINSTQPCWYDKNDRGACVFTEKADTPYAATAMYMMGGTYLVLVICFGTIPLCLCLDEDDPWCKYSYGAVPLETYLHDRRAEVTWSMSRWRPRHESEPTCDLILCPPCYCGGWYCSDARMCGVVSVKPLLWALVVLLCAGACFVWSLLFFSTRYYDDGRRQTNAGTN